MQRAEMNELLTKVKELLSQEILGFTYSTWIQPIEIYTINGNLITLCVPSDIHKSTIESKYLPIIKNAFAFITHIDYDIEIRIGDSSQIEKEEEANNQVTHFNANNNSGVYSKSNLDPKFTFESFVQGKNNEIACAAALAVSEAPGTTAYNPLFLYGGVGLGKTHLMYAIGNAILKANPNMNILYITSEQFNNNLISGIQEGKMEAFRNKYRNVDVLIVDDIQFIAGRDTNQEEFFNTFNTLHAAGKQIIISSDRPPKDIQPLEDRLRSRFGGGLIVDISNPSYETRMAILQKEAQLNNIIIDTEILSNIATKVDTNVRELKGALNKLLILSKLKKVPLSIALSEEAISDIISNKNRVISAEYIQEVVSKYFDISVDDIKGSRRSSDVVMPRQIAMYLCKSVAQMPYKKIGQAFGKRDHTTVMYACDKIEEDMKENTKTKLIVETVKNSLFSDNDL